MQHPSNEPITSPLCLQISLQDLTIILIKHYGHHEGFYEVGVQFNITVGSVGPDANQVAPGAIVTVGGIGLSRCPQSNPMCIDASQVNPAPVKVVKTAARKKAVK